MDQDFHTHGFGLSNFWVQGDFVSHLVLLILLIMSVLSWMQIGLKAWRAYNRGRIFKAVDNFWASPSLEKAQKTMMDELGENHNFTCLAKDAITSLEHFEKKHHEIGQNLNRDEFITRTLRQSINRSQAKLESGMTILASIGAIAPFVGLFGTVYGIYHALLGISASGSASIGAVSGPVGEALIMTALGLFVAIPAVLAYNAFVRFNRLEAMEMDGFAYDLHSFLTTGSKVTSAKKHK